MTARPLPPGPIEHDENGDPVPVPAEDSDVRDLQQLLEWARLKGFHLAGGMRVGKISIQRVVDLRQHEARVSKDDDPGVWAEHGFEPGADS